MTFGAAAFLLATVAAVIPVILHMINRRKAKQFPFPTLRFLKISVQKTRRRRQIHDVLLMLLRMAVLILIAIGLARPLMERWPSLLGGGTNSAVAIILDNSASMGVLDQGRLRFDTAINAANQIMDELQDGDQVALWVTCGVKFPEEGRLDKAHDKVRQMLGQLAQASATYERSDLAPTLQEARKQLAKVQAANKQIFILTDNQALAWEGLKQETAPPGTAAEPENLTEEQRKMRDIPILIVDCNRAPKPNVAVQDVRLETIIPVAGVPIKAVVDLFNAAPVAQQRVVELYIDGVRKASSPQVNIPANGRLTQDLQFTVDRGGLHRGEVRLLGDDGSKLDDRRFFTLEVDPGIPVAIVTAQRHEIPYLDDSFYLEHALAPARAGSWAIRTTVLTAAQLIAEPVSQFKVVYCVNLPAPDADIAQWLRTFVEQGGHLVWTCGENVNPEAYNQANQQAGGRLLPAPLVAVRTPDPAENRDSWRIAYLNKQHRALSHLVEPAALYQSVLVYKYVRMDVTQVPDATVLARLDGEGDPILVQRTMGEGSVTMLGTGVHVGWTNLPLRPIFLPLVARVTFELAGAEQGRHQALAGTPIVLQFEDQIRPTGIEVVPPSGATIRPTLETSATAPAKEFRYADTHEVGIYLLRLIEAVRPTQVAYAVNVDPEEADPTKIQPEELQKLLAGTRITVIDDPDRLAEKLDELRKGKSLAELFLFGVLFALIFETFLANWFSPKKEQDQLEHVPVGMRRLARKPQAA